jgi:hypothetical protein
MEIIIVMIVTLSLHYDKNNHIVLLYFFKEFQNQKVNEVQRLGDLHRHKRHIHVCRDTQMLMADKH